ncbi:MAG: hypothetical protein ACRC0A_05620, partial [Chitinophagaceae bacterium]
MSLFKIGNKLKLKYTHEEVVILKQLSTEVYLVQKNKEQIPIHQELLEISNRSVRDSEQEGFYILLKPDIEYQQGTEFSIQNMAILLWNQTPQYLECQYTMYIKNEIFFQHKNINLPLLSQQQIIHTLPLEKWHNSTFIVLDFTGRKNNLVNAKLQFQLKHKIIFKELQTAITKEREPILLFKKFTTIEEIITTIDQVILPQPFSLSKTMKTLSSVKDKLLPAVIDLHIEKIMPDYPLSKNEILSYQIEYFCNIIDKILYQGMDKITIIHGVGKGKLKQAIHE